MITAANTFRAKTSSSAATPQIPPLQNGDTLTLAEFERRYEAMPDLKKAELIEGKVYMAPPVSIDENGEPHIWLCACLGICVAHTRGVRSADNSTVRLAPKSMPQPDVLLFTDERFGGRVRFDQKSYPETAPDLVAEIAASSASYDLNEKMQLYEREGVREYIVWRTFDEAFDYFILTDGKYVRHSPDDAGVFHSTIYPGLRIDSKSLLAGNLAAALATVQAGVSSEPHAEFLNTLKPKA